MIGEKTSLIPIRQTLTDQRYVDLVLQPVVRLWRGGFGNLFLFMQDSAPPHTSTVAKCFLETEGVAVSEWPSCSPDLNSIQHLWDKIKRKIKARQNGPGNTEQLIQAVLEEWTNVPQDTDNLINSMPGRIRACIDARGANTDY